MGAKVLTAVSALKDCVSSQSVKGLAEETHRLVLVLCPVRRRVAATHVDTAQEGATDKSLGSVPVATLVGNVVLHTRLGVNLELARVDGATEARVDFTGVLAIGVALGVVNVLGGEVAAETLFGNFKLASDVAVG